MAAVAGYPLVGVELGDVGATGGTWLAALAMHLQEVSDLYVDVFTHTLLQDFYRLFNHGPGLLVEPGLFLGAQRAGLAEGR